MIIHVANPSASEAVIVGVETTPTGQVEMIGGYDQSVSSKCMCKNKKREMLRCRNNSS